MSKKDRLAYKALNAMAMQEEFIDKDDDYLYASITQPPLKVVDKNGSDDEFKWTVICPNCGRNVNFGNETKMRSGKIYCDYCEGNIYTYSNEMIAEVKRATKYKTIYSIIMIKTTWLEVFDRINKGLIKDQTKFYYKNDLYTYFEDDNAIYSIEAHMDKGFCLDEILDTCYILADLNKDE